MWRASANNAYSVTQHPPSAARRSIHRARPYPGATVTVLRPTVSAKGQLCRSAPASGPRLTPSSPALAGPRGRLPTMSAQANCDGLSLPPVHHSDPAGLRVAGPRGLLPTMSAQANCDGCACLRPASPQAQWSGRPQCPIHQGLTVSGFACLRFVAHSLLAGPRGRLLPVSAQANGDGPSLPPLCNPLPLRKGQVSACACLRPVQHLYHPLRARLAVSGPGQVARAGCRTGQGTVTCAWSGSSASHPTRNRMGGFDRLSRTVSVSDPRL